MSRVIKTGSAGKDRILLEKGIILAIRELTEQSGMDDTTRDLLAYIALSLKAIGETIDESVAAWEKRGYWIKADRYRMEWLWASNWGEEMKQAILKEDWAACRQDHCPGDPEDEQGKNCSTKPAGNSMDWLLSEANKPKS